MELIKKRQTLRLPARASVWYITASAIGRGIGVFGTPIFTRLLDAKEYGLYPLYNTWLGIATVFVTLELTGASALRGLQKFENKKSEFLCSAVGLICVSFAIICTLYSVAHTQINRFTGLSTPISYVMLMQIFVNAVINLYCAGARYKYHYKRVAAINTAAAILSPVISVAIITLTQYKAEGRIIGGLIATSLIGLPILITLIEGGRRLYNKEMWRYLLTMALPLLPHYISTTAIIRIGEITVGRVHGTAELGKYSVAMSLGLSLSIVTGGLLSAVGPWILRHIRQNDFLKIREVLLLLTRGLCLFALLILSVVPETIMILTPSEYHDVLPAVYPLVLSGIPTFLSSAVTSGQIYYERTAVTSIPAIISCIASTLFSLFLLPKTDYRFAGLFVLLSYIILLVGNILIFKTLSKQTPIKVKETALIYLLSLAYGALLMLLRESTVTRLVLAAPLIPLLLSVIGEAYKIIREPGELKSFKM